MRQKNLEELYFHWICSKVGNTPHRSSRTYEELLGYLHKRYFSYTIPMDGNRASDGIALRYRFGEEAGIDERIIACELDIHPCTVLEMMAALAIRCEEHIMANPEYGDRTGKWFWGMIYNLGLSRLYDGRFRVHFAERCIDRFLNREYDSDGVGGLFTIGSDKGDARSMEIWYQLNCYLTSMD